MVLQTYRSKLPIGDETSRKPFGKPSHEADYQQQCCSHAGVANPGTTIVVGGWPLVQPYRLLLEAAWNKVEKNLTLPKLSFALRPRRVLKVGSQKMNLTTCLPAWLLVGSMLNANVECWCWVPMLNAHDECQHWLSILNANVECQCWMSMLNANVECQCWMSMLNANAECQCWMPMLNVNADCQR